MGEGGAGGEEGELQSNCAGAEAVLLYKMQLCVSKHKIQFSVVFSFILFVCF